MGGWGWIWGLAAWGFGVWEFGGLRAIWGWGLGVGGERAGTRTNMGPEYSRTAMTSSTRRPAFSISTLTAGLRTKASMPTTCPAARCESRPRVANHACRARASSLRRGRFIVCEAKSDTEDARPAAHRPRGASSASA